MISKPAIMSAYSPSMSGISHQRTIVAFPIRGTCNPFCGSLFPLILLTLAAFLLNLAALIAAASIPATRAFYLLESSFINVRVAGLILFSIVLILTGTIFLLYFCNFFNFCDSILTPIILNLVTLLSIGILVPIGVMMISAEFALPSTDSVNDSMFLLSGILALSASLPLIVGLFLSRFYEFSIGNYKTQKKRIERVAEIVSSIEGKPGLPRTETHHFYKI